MVARSEADPCIAVGQPHEPLVESPTPTGSASIAALPVLKRKLQCGAAICEIGEFLALTEGPKNADSTIEHNHLEHRVSNPVGEQPGRWILRMPMDVVLQLTDCPDDLLGPGRRETSLDCRTLQSVPELSPGIVFSVSMVAADANEPSRGGGSAVHRGRPDRIRV